MIAKFNFKSVDNPPKRDGHYFVICEGGLTFSDLSYSTTLNKWNCTDGCTDHEIKIVSWAEFPQNLKNECTNEKIKSFKRHFLCKK